ncbi:MAG: hypothetical protein HGGPFJEG_00534 [Ignavibacteria bacterium]|nr:hypothetical protein [Ignavibacteria bacterium]
MKKSKLAVLLVIPALFLFLYSCSDDSTGNNTNPSVVTSIGGTINGLPANSRIIKSEISNDSLTFLAGTDTATSSGAFSINLSAPPNNVLRNLADLFSFIPNDNNFSSAAMGNFLFSNTYSSDSSYFSGNLMKSNRYITNNNMEIGDYSISYLYCNANENFTGNYLSIFNADSFKYNVSLNLQTGYNPVTYTLKTKRTNYKEFDITGGETAGASWYYYGLLDNLFMPFKYE